MRPSTSDLAAFFSRVDTSCAAPCWLWTACLNGKGYGGFRGNSAHRFAYEWFVGPIPERFHVDHLCKVRRCVNPAHLEAVTAYENYHRSNSWRTVYRCRVRAHDLSVAGVYLAKGKKGVIEQTCLECRTLTRARFMVRRGVIQLGEKFAAALMREHHRLAAEKREAA